MYSVFIADDEHIVLEGMRKKISMESSAFSLIGEATDGEIAFSMIQELKPDILITDIKMPFMDGLELSRLLKKIQPWLKIIILSGHDEFEYAKEAISIGVEDYILKPFTSEELEKSLAKVARAIDKEKQEEKDLTKLKAELESSAILLKNKFLTDLVLGNVATAEIFKTAKELDINLLARYYKLAVSDVRNTSASFDMSAIDEAKSALLSLSRSSPLATAFFISPVRMVSILKGNDKGELEEYSYNFAEAVSHLVSLQKSCIVITSLSSTVEHSSLIAESYREALRVLEQSRFYNKSRIISADDVAASCDGMLSLQENDPLVERLKYAQKEEISSIIAQYLEMLNDNSESFHVIASYLFVDVVVAVSHLAENLGGNIKELMPEILTHSFVENAVQNPNVFEKEVRKILESILAFRDSRIQGRYGDVILKAKDYIQNNFKSQDTCLKSVASAVNFSPNHFSTIFSQECGMTFIEYLTNVRIEEAKKLLRTTDMKGADIAYESGFSDPHYFSFIFKKTTGLSPRDYKQQLS